MLFRSGWSDEDDPHKMPSHFFHSAWELDCEGAVRANIDAQNYSVHPRFWYIDAWQNCIQCGSAFVFTIAEQQFWYEELRFWVGSYPTRCKACRRSQRALLEAKQRYGELREQAIRRDAPNELKIEVIGLLDQIESAGEQLPERMRECRDVLCKQIVAMDSDDADPNAD